MKRKIIYGILFLFLFITLLISSVIIFGPNLANNYLNNNGKDLIGRKVNIEDIDLNLFNGKLAISDFNIYEEDDTTSFVYFKQFILDIHISSLFKRHIFIEEIALINPNINISYKDNDFNFASLTKKDTTAIETETDTSSFQNPFNKFTIDNFNIQSGAINYANYDHNIKHNIDNFSMVLPHITLGESTTDVDLEFDITQGGTFKTKLNFNSDKGEYKWNLELSELNLNVAKAYVDSTLNLNDLQGILSTSLNITGDIKTIDEPKIKGELTLDNLSLVDNKDLEFFALKHLQIITEDLDLKEYNFPIDKIEIDGFKFSYVQYKNSSNLDRLIIEKQEKKEDIETVEKVNDTIKPKVVKWRVNNIKLRNSKINFSDYSNPYGNFIYSLNDISIDAKDIRFGNESPIKFSTRTPDGGKIRAVIKTDPADTKNGNFDIYIENVNAVNFTPYTLDNVAYPIKSGKIYVSTNNVIRNNHIDSRIIIDAHNTHLGSKRKDIEPKSGDLPLKTALAIVRDKDDRIRFDIKMQGDLDDPDFNYGKAIYKVFSTTIFKIALSPFNLISKGLGIDEGDLKRIEFENVHEKLTPSQQTQLDNISKLLNDNKSFVANFILNVNRENDIKKIRKQRAKSDYFIEQTLNNSKTLNELNLTELETLNKISDNDNSLNKYLKDKLNISTKTSNKDLFKIYTSTEQANTLLDKLNNSRLNNIKSYLSGKQNISYKVEEVIQKTDKKNSFIDVKYNGE